MNIQSIPHVQMQMLLTVTGTGMLCTAASVSLEQAFGYPSLIPLLILAVIGGVSLVRVGSFHPHSQLGWANVITFMRGGIIVLFAAPLFAVKAAPMEAGPAWGAAAFALVALALDGVDGYAARRQRLVSRFGARLDMELDALFILLLSALAYVNAKAGIWVLGLGLMRYGFLLAGRFLPELGHPLPHSTRRQTVCVVQILVLIALLAPVITPPVSQFLAFGALILLVWSFFVDTVWLLRKSHA